MTNRCVVAVAQMTSSNDTDANFDVVNELAAQAHARGAKLLCLPECFAFMGEQDGATLAVMEALSGPLFERYRALALRHQLWLAYGGFAERADADHTYNTHVLVDDTGTLRATYKKIHLFDVQLKNGTSYRESACTAAGDSIVVAASPAGQLGLSICYDLRFAELYAALVAAGAQVLLVPAAFTLTTGKEHWEVLLRARAIETQCYVLAAAQGGRHNARRDTNGHAMIVDPWGSVVAQCSDGTGIACAEIDLDFVAEVRARMPVRSHRRAELWQAQ